MEKILSPLIPTMTSNNTPSGECYSPTTLYMVDEPQYYYTYDSWKALDKNESTKWISKSTDSWYQYKFDNQVKAYVLTLRPEYAYGVITIRTFSIVGSNDGTNWTELLNAEIPDDESSVKNWSFILKNRDLYQYYRINAQCNQGSNSSNGLRIIEMQLYG